MNDHTISLVKESFDLVTPIAPQAAALFYANLFEADPELKPLFRADKVVQGHPLMQMLELAVNLLDQSGVQDRHHDCVDAALLKTLRQGLGAAWSPEVEEAWTEVYGVVASTIKEAAALPA